MCWKSQQSRWRIHVKPTVSHHKLWKPGLKCNSLPIRASSISCMPIKSEKITDVLPFLGDFGVYLQKKNQTNSATKHIVYLRELVSPAGAAGSFKFVPNPRTKQIDRNGSQDGHASNWTTVHLKHGGMQRSKTHCQYNQPFLFKAQTQIALIMRINTPANLERCVWREGELCRSRWKIHKSMWLFKNVTAVWS